MILSGGSKDRLKLNSIISLYRCDWFIMSCNSTARTGYLTSSTKCNEICSSGDVSVTSSVITMTVGIVSNALALFILLKAYRRLHLKSKASFLLCASGLVVTDCLGHLINGSLALYVYASNKDWENFDPKHIMCGFFGVCMAFFGLSPLLLGGIMAVERCIGVTRPLFHSTVLTSQHINRLLLLTWLVALFVALLPVLVWRPYKVQGSRSWCFFRLVGIRDWLDVLLPMIFSVLGLLALLVSFVCNTVTGFTLLWSRLHHKRDYCHCRRSSLHCEMICQLLAIMLVSWVCWGPFLVTVIITSLQLQGNSAYSYLLLTVRLATWNQILDPWVYILLRKAVLKQLFLLTQKCHSPRPKRAFAWQFNALGSSLEASSSVNSRPDLICLDGPFLPDTLMDQIRHFH